MSDFWLGVGSGIGVVFLVGLLLLWLDGDYGDA